MTDDYPRVTKGAEPFTWKGDGITVQGGPIPQPLPQLPRRAPNFDPEREVEDLRSIADVLEQARRQERERIIAAIRKQAQAPALDVVIEVLDRIADALETGRL